MFCKVMVETCPLKDYYTIYRKYKVKFQINQTKGKGDTMQAIKAVFDGVNFKPKEPIPVEGKYEVIITFVEEVSSSYDADKQEKIKRDKNFWKGFDKLVAEAKDEVLCMEDFERNKLSRELIIFDDDDNEV